MEGVWRMKQQEIEKELRKLIRSRGNDAVRLACLDREELPDIRRMDLNGVVSFKRGEKGGFEVKFVDKVRILELLTGMEREDEEGPGDYIQAQQKDDGV